MREGGGGVIGGMWTVGVLGVLGVGGWRERGGRGVWERRRVWCDVGRVLFCGEWESAIVSDMMCVCRLIVDWVSWWEGLRGICERCEEDI